MNLMCYQFQESKLPTDFCKDKVNEIKQLIDNSCCFTVVGMPGMGISTFLKFLATQTFAYFIHVDLYELTSFDKTEFFKLFADQLKVEPRNIKKELFRLTKKHSRVVIIFNRFDQLKESFDENLFMNLRSLREVDKEKIVMIFSANKPLYLWSPSSFKNGNLEMYSKIYFLKPYHKKELITLIKLYKPDLDIGGAVLEQYIDLSGGHLQLLQLLINCRRSSNYLQDDFVKFQIERIVGILSLNERLQLKKILSKPKTPEISELLINYGIIRKVDGNYDFFSSLLREYLQINNLGRLSRFEMRLFNLLKHSMGKVVTKDEIISQVWQDKSSETTDWALNALIYRLRKNPRFMNSGYNIESYKRIGYFLTKL
mgnify:CR=1 FL=1